MNDRTIMRRLIWKDSASLKPLVTAILIGIVAIDTVLAFLTLSFETSEMSGFFVSFWVLMPNLVALGAPALLVGGEEESGTLGWLRTLPVRWQKVADSKFLVALGAVAVAWLASSLLLFLLRRTDIAQSSLYGDGMLSAASIAYLLFFSTLLLICGFITGYLFRSPIVGLIAVVPLIAVVSMLALSAGRWILTGDVRDRGAIGAPSASSMLLMTAGGAILLVATWGVQRLLACRRLTSPDSDALRNLSHKATTSAYRPPALVGSGRPSQSWALLWQQFRQMGRVGAALTIVIAAFLVLAVGQRVSNSSGAIRFLQEVSPMVVMVGTCWLGGLVFYGDNVRRRCAFFADRGIGPTRIWWTRLLFPSLCCLALVAILGCSLVADAEPSFEFRSIYGMAVSLIVTFAFGVLVGQWMQRPVMTFFAGPAYTVVASLTLFLLFSLYPAYVWTALLIAPVLLFASWRLAPRWLAGNVDLGYHGRVLAYTALAVAVPIVVVCASRIGSTPERMPQWRARMLAIQLPGGTVHGDGQRDYQGISPDAFHVAGFSNAFRTATAGVQREMLDQELDSDTIGDYVSLDDIDIALGYRNGSPLYGYALKHAAIAVLLKWDRKVREGVVEGRNTLWDLENVAEVSEARAIEALLRIQQDRSHHGQLQELIELIPDAQLRHRSRRNGLIAAWQAYQHQNWRHESGGHVTYGKNFMRFPAAERLAGLPFERTRCDRFIDEATKLTLDQLDGQLPLTDASPGYVTRNQLWAEALRRPWASGRFVDVVLGKSWTSAYQQRIDRLKD